LLGAFALAIGIGACGASGAEEDAAPSEPTVTTCSLAIRLAGGGVVFDSNGSDTKACANPADTGPGMDLTFFPSSRSVVSSIEITAPGVDAGTLGTALPAVVTVQHADGRTSRPTMCQVTLLENTRVTREARGDRYRVRGTGACASRDRLTGVGVDGTFAFATSTVWAKP